MAITQNHIINIQPGVSAPLVIHCSQGDTGSVINLTVVNGDEVFDCSTYACSVHGVRSDGANWGPYEVTVSGSTVSFSLRQEMTAIAGPCLAEITIGTVGTANFAILVENATFSLGVTYTEDVSLYQSILNYIMGAVQDIKTETTASVNKAIDQMNTNTSALNAKYDKTITTTQNQYAVTNAKLDTAISAATRDSEVQDIRVKADGTSAATAGNAVREQVTGLKNDLDALINVPITTNNGYINTDGTIHEQSSSGEVYTNRISVLPAEKFKVRLVYPENKWAWLVYAQYDLNGNFISRVSVPNSSGNQAIVNEVITIPTNVYSIAFSYRTYGNATFTVSNLQNLSELSSYLPELISDLSELSSDLSSCNNTIPLSGSLLANGTILKILSPEYGGFNDVGEEVKSTTRIRSGFFENRNNGIYITPKSGYMFGFHLYGGGTHTWSGWKTVKTEIPVNESIRILFDSSPSGSVTPDLDEWNDKFTLSTDMTEQVAQPQNVDFAMNIGSISRLGYQPGFPQCSLPAYREAYKKGFRIMLCPVRWTSDNIPVCLHDETINSVARNDDGTVLSDTVRIADITLEQANAYDWGIVSGASFRGLKMPTLESVVRFAKFMNCEIYVEIKGLPTDAQLESMYNIIDSYNIEKSLTFSASYLSVLEKVTVRYPSARLGYGVNPSGITQANIASMQALKTNVNEVFFHVWKDNEASGIITPEMLALLKGSNVGFELTEIQNESTFNSFIEDSNNSYVTRVAIRYMPVEYYLRGYFLGE